MANQAQSEPKPSPVSDRAGMIEHAAAHGRVVTRSPNSELYIEHTPQIVPPPAPDTSARAQVALRVVDFEKIVEECEAAHQAAIENVAEAQKARLQTPNQEWTRQMILTSHEALVLASSHLDGAKTHRDHIVGQIAAWEASGKLDAYDAAVEAQSGHALDRALAPLVKRATKVGGDLGRIANETVEAVAEILAARRRASALAAELGLSRHRDSGIDVRSATLKISKAFLAGFCSAGHRADALRDWVGGR